MAVLYFCFGFIFLASICLVAVCLGRDFMTLCSIAIPPSLQSFGRDQPETHSLAIALYTQTHTGTRIHTTRMNGIVCSTCARLSALTFLHTSCVDFTPKFKPTLIHRHTHTLTMCINRTRENKSNNTKMYSSLNQSNLRGVNNE